MSPSFLCSGTRRFSQVYELRRRFYKLKEQEKGNQPIEGALMEGEGGEGKESSVNLGETSEVSVMGWWAMV